MRVSELRAAVKDLPADGMLLFLSWITVSLILIPVIMAVAPTIGGKRFHPPSEPIGRG